MSHIFEDTAFREKPSRSTEDWGIESDSDICLSGSSDDESAHVKRTQNAPSKTALPTDRQRPIKSGRDGRVYTREIRLRSLIRALFSQEVSLEETERFLEQFRYIIISSSLLEKQPLFSQWSIPSDLRRKRLLFDTSRPWTQLYVQKITGLGGSSALAAVAYYLHLRYRASSSQTERNAVALIIFLVVIVYLFATNRRRLLRSLREKTLVYMDMFIQSCKYLDGDVVRVLKELQEIELVSNGFEPNARPNQFSIDNNHQYAGRKSRSLLASTLHILQESYISALRECIGMVSSDNFGKFLEIYSVRDVMADYKFELHTTQALEGTVLSFKFCPDSFDHTGAAACHVPITILKRELRNVHFIRRVSLCVLSSLEAVSGDFMEDLGKWTTIVDHIKHVGELNEQFSRIISRENIGEGESEEDESMVHGQSTQRNRGPLVDVMARVKHLNARLDIINDVTPTSQEYSVHVSAVKDEINDLMFKWTQFLDLSKPSTNSPIHERPQRSRINSTSIFSSPTLVEAPDFIESSAFSSTMNDFDSCASVGRNSVYAPAIIEGESPMFVMPANSKSSRDERIKLAQKSRTEKHVYEQSNQSGSAQELTNVLLMRNRVQHQQQPQSG